MCLTRFIDPSKVHGKRTTSEFGGHSHYGCDPHPENRTRTTYEDSGGNTHDVSGAYGCRERRRKGAEMADLSGIILSVKGSPQDLHPMAEGAKLNE
jgi:hypothetical protein